MNQEQIEIGNRIIAEFMEHTPYSLEYDIEWRALMEVVEKIEAMLFDTFISKDTRWIEVAGEYQYVTTYSMVITDFNNNMVASNKSIAKTKIEAVHLAVIEFITWHNAKTK